MRQDIIEVSRDSVIAASVPAVVNVTCDRPERRSPKIPADEQRYPYGCPDPEWCRGNRLCYWKCQADPDAAEKTGVT